MNLRTTVPHLVRKPNRPEPAGRIRRPFVAAATALLAILLAFAHVGASDAGTMRGFASSSGTVIVVGELPMDSTSQARTAVRMMDASAIESSMGVLIIDHQPLSRDLTRTFDLEAATISGGFLDDGTPFLLLIYAQGPAVTLAMMAGDELDGDMFAEWTVRLFMTGAEDIAAPFGYVEVPMDGRDTADTETPFDGLIEGRI